MVTKIFCETISQFLEEEFKGKTYRLNDKIMDNPIVTQKLRDKFGLKCICNHRGTTRLVFKQKYSRSVFKIGDAPFNKAEWTFWNAAKEFEISNLLAECKNISSNGTVLEQENVRFKLPYKYRGDFTSKSYADFWFDMENNLTDIFSFLQKKLQTVCLVTPDFHDENLHVSNSGDIRIIDYASILDTYFSRSRKAKGTKVAKIVKESIKKNDKYVQFYLNYNKNIMLNGVEYLA
jgi:hypothetical protein